MISGGFLLAFISLTLFESSESTAAWALICAGMAAASYLSASSLTRAMAKASL